MSTTGQVLYTPRETITLFSCLSQLSPCSITVCRQMLAKYRSFLNPDRKRGLKQIFKTKIGILRWRASMKHILRVNQPSNVYSSYT